MKKCIICKKDQELEEFYKHSKMEDGHLNKCKTCCKNQAKDLFHKKMKDSIFLEKERARGREKGKRLGNKKPSNEISKKRFQKFQEKYPEKVTAHKKCMNLPRKNGCQLHHWSYNEEHYKDIIELTIAEHGKYHRFMIYDQERKMYRNLEGVLLDTKQRHLDYLKTLINKPD